MKRKILLGLSSIIAIAPVAIAAGCGGKNDDKTPWSSAGTDKLNKKWTSTKTFANLPLSLKTPSTRDIKEDYIDSTKSGYTEALAFKIVDPTKKLQYPKGFELKSVRVVSVEEDTDKKTNKLIYKVTYRVTVSSDTERGYENVVVTYI